jgi:predicted metalloprotease with PDZ domain
MHASTRLIRILAIVGAALVLWSAPALRASAAPAATIALDVDAHDAPRGVIHVHERVPVAPGSVTFVYPKWLPGEHMPAGPIINAGGFVMRAGPTTIAWRRDLDEPYTVHVDVPAGVTSIDVDFDIFGAPVGGYSDARFATTNMIALTWNKVLLVPQVADYRTIVIAPTLRLPGTDWQFATALEPPVRDGATLTFAPVTMEKLVDSPLDAGTVARRWQLGTIDGAPVDLAAFADTPDELDASDATIGKFRRLVAEMAELYHARHFAHYTFLLTVSDVMAGNGVEHQQSSDDGSDGNFLTDANALLVSADLLSHEFNHAWDGKYRRPAGLATPNLQVPMHDDLLWVYEGMTEYYGDVLATRSGLRPPDQWRERMAATYASLDAEPGRLVRPLQDTADAASVLYGAPAAFAADRRGVDFYSEGELLWLEADVTIRRLSHGARSLDDVARAFFGGTSTGPEVVTYTRDDVIAALAAVQPYDWRTFFARRVDAIAPHPPDPFTPGGWRVVFVPTRTPYEIAREDHGHTFDARYSLGFTGRADGSITDVLDGSLAARAGIAPGAKIVAIDDVAVRGSLRGQLDPALVGAQHGDGTLRLLVLQGGRYREVTLVDHDGPRYPDLERVPGVTNVLDDVTKPRRGGQAL